MSTIPEQETIQSDGFDLFRFMSLFGLDINPQECKFHFAKSNDQLDHDRFRTTEGFQKFQSYQTARNFERKFVVAFYQWDENKWIFSGVWRVNGDPVPKEVRPGKAHYIYNTELVRASNILVRRLLVTWPDRFRNSYPNGETLAKGLLLHSVLDAPDALGRFPGYGAIKLSLEAIRQLIKYPERSIEWKTALSNVPGVYLLADKQNGKLYVGSAYGESGLWQRWETYAKTGHGNNKELRDVVNKSDPEYPFQNFVFSLLWYGGAAVSAEEVLHKESFWKEALMTREFGYNAN